MWDAKSLSNDADDIQQMQICSDGRPLSYAEVLNSWENDRAFAAFFNSLLAAAPYQAYLWETPPVTRSTVTRPFEFVLVNSPALGTFAPDRSAFAEHFDGASGQQVVGFANLGGDAFLIAPCPDGPQEAYPHLAAFVRSADTAQQAAFWKSMAAALAERLTDKPLWLSTCGLGVAWLHARIDTRPKYYRFAPYREGY